jgi:hypothetical protein
MPRKDGYSLVAMPNFVHIIYEDRFYTLYLEGCGGEEVAVRVHDS